MRRFYRWLAIGCGFSCAWLTPASLSEAAGIAGVVQDASSTPIALASVTLMPGNYAAVTDQNGSYQIADISAGTYSAIAYAPSKNEQTIAGLAITAGGTTVADFTLTDSGKVTYLLDDFNGDYIFTGDTLEESFQLGFHNHEYFGEYLPDRILPPHVGSDASQKFEVTINNDQFVSYFETREPGTDDRWFNLVQHAAANGWEEINTAEPITYVVYVKGMNMADDPDDVANKYWRPALSAHHPETNYDRQEINITGANENRWQMLRASSLGLHNGTKIWLTFESWYPAGYGQWLTGTSWMVFENLTVEYTPMNPVDTTPPGSVASFSATAGVRRVTLLWQNPSDSDFEGTRIHYRTDRFPSGPDDGTLLADVAGSPDANASWTHTDPPAGVVYYAAYAYDAVPNYAAGATAWVTIVPIAPADFDGDGDVDIEDFGTLQRCYTGPGVPQDDGACVLTLLDTDSDVDQDDFGLFQACFSGPNIPADPNCGH